MDRSFEKSSINTSIQSKMEKPLKEEVISLKQRIYFSYMKFMVWASQILRLSEKEENFEENKKVVMIHFALIASCIIQLVIDGVFIGLCSIGFGSWIVFPVSGGTIVFTFLLGVVMWVLKTKRKILATVFSFLLCFVFVTATVIVSNVFIGNAISIAFLLPPVYLFNIDCNFYIKLFWAFMGMLFLFVAFGYHLALLLMDMTATYTMTSAQAIGYITFEFFIFFIVDAMITFFSSRMTYKINMFKKSRKRLVAMLNVIRKMNFEVDEVKEFFSVPEYTLPDMDLMLKGIVEQVIAYKPHIPKSLLAENSSDKSHNHSNLGDEKLSVHSIDSSSNSEFNDQQSKNSSDSSKESFEKRFEVKEPIFKRDERLQKRGKQVNEGLKKMKGTMVMIMINNIRELIKELGLPEYEDVFANFVGIVEKSAQKSKGVVLKVGNDYAVVGYGLASRSFTNPVENALNSSWEMMKIFKKQNVAHISISISTGKFVCGFIGSKDSKFFSYYGEKVDLEIRMKKYLLNHTMNENVILICEDTYEKVKFMGDFYLATAFEVKTSIRSQKKTKNKLEGKIVLYSVCDVKKRGEDEWMYQIGEKLQERKDDFGLYISAIDFWYEKKFEEAENQLKKYIEEKKLDRNHFLNKTLEMIKCKDDPEKCFGPRDRHGI